MEIRKIAILLKYVILEIGALKLINNTEYLGNGNLGYVSQRGRRMLIPEEQNSSFRIVQNRNQRYSIFYLDQAMNFNEGVSFMEPNDNNFNICSTLLRDSLI